MSLTANQVSAALTVAIAALRHVQEKVEADNITLESLEPDHFASDEIVGSEEIERAIMILNSVFDVQSLTPNEVFPDDPDLPDVGAPGWLNRAIDSYQPDNTF